jgi:DNA-directed RNA polymerase subunit RPC12/RpoP
MGLEYMCQNCGVRLDPLMTKDEAQYFMVHGCPMCDHNSWVIVEGIYDEVKP